MAVLVLSVMIGRCGLWRASSTTGTRYAFFGSISAGYGFWYQYTDLLSHLYLGATRSKEPKARLATIQLTDERTEFRIES
jgi:hypothetical protein